MKGSDNVRNYIRLAKYLGSRPTVRSARLAGLFFALILALAPASALAQPAISVPAELQFGNVPINFTSDMTLTVSNTGSAPLNVSNIATSRAEYTVSQTSFTVAAGSSQDVTVTFGSAAPGTKNGTLTITHDAVGGSTDVSLKGRGANVPMISVSGSMSFGSVTAGSPSSQTLTVSNVAGASLDVTAIALSGTDAADFAVSPATISVGAGGSEDLTITFTPGSAGAKTASMSLTHNAVGTPTSVSLDGTGTVPAAPEISVSGSLGLGTSDIGSPVSANLTISNTGTATLNVSGITVGGGDAGMFSVSPTALSIAAGNNQDVTVTFTPGSAGAKAASLSITHDAPGTPTSVALSGTGTVPAVPEISVSGSLGLGASDIGSPVSANLTISNTGTATLNVSGISVGGGDAGMFSVSPTTLSIASGGNQVVTVTFTPGSAGAKTASLAIAHDAPGTPTSVALGGTGEAVGQAVISTPITVAFGDVEVGEVVTRTVSIANTGNITLDVSEVSITGTGNTVFSVSQGPVSVGVASSVDLTVSFVPKAMGEASAVLSIASNAPGSPTSIGLSGTGLLGHLTVTPTALNFGEVVVGGSKLLFLSVSNAGNADLSISDISASSSSYLVVSANILLAPGESQDVPVTFVPKVEGDVAGSIALTHSDGKVSTHPVSGTAEPAVAQDATESPGQTEVPKGPELTLSAGALDFGEVRIGSYTTLTVNVANTGTETLQVTDISSDDGSFGAVTSQFALPASESREVEVRFTPGLMGDFSGTLTVSHSAAGGNATVGLRGSGVLACLASVNEVDFCDVAVGESVTRELVLENEGNAPLVVMWISLNGSQFSVDARHFTVLPTTPRTINLIYTASAPGEQTGSVRILSNVAGGVTDIALKGNGIGPELCVSTRSVIFGAVDVDGQSTQELAVTNPGTSTLTLSAIGVSNSAFEAPSEPFSLAPGESTTLPVTFRPVDQGSVDGSLVLEGNCYRGTPCVVSLSGEGLISVPTPSTGADTNPVRDPIGEPASDVGDSQDPTGDVVAAAGDDTPVTPPVKVGTVALVPTWEGDLVTKSIAPIAVQPGQEATFQVTADEVPSGTGYWLAIAYDADVLTFAGLQENTDFLPDARRTVTDNKGHLVINLASTTGLESLTDGVLCELSFRINSTFQDTARVALEGFAVVLASGEFVQAVVGPGYELVKDPTLVQLEEIVADFNGDGQVDFADYLILVRDFGKPGIRCDLNGDGSVGFGDYLILIRWIAKVSDV
jgi:hypothetical protein